MGRNRSEKLQSLHKQTFGSNLYVPYLDCGECICKSKIFKLYTLNMYGLLCVY